MWHIGYSPFSDLFQNRTQWHRNEVGHAVSQISVLITALLTETIS
ncbi:hypothetical protein CES85_3628 (plasmid) [Ochrobactrum quorumnocens]|uniref:Uncharacterized protein n=1 Tax=Ochrobactrum quorumnocens TaxID=271865 RepID=A0A248UNY1_9HYPH|nr:hypothetical protein CES85_3628 [[Ochrobactrum] quorumnocens]